MPKKTYTTTKGNKYELTNKHFKQYQLIKDKTSNQFGLIENTDPNTQLVRLEPIYSNINLMNHKIVKLLAIIENENKFGLYDLFSLKEIVMPIYDSIRFDQNDNQYFDGQEIIIYKNGKVGRIEINETSQKGFYNTIIIEPEYDMMIRKNQFYMKSKNFYLVKKNNIYYYIANDGTVYYD
jgi:hypothetical protein